MEVDERGKRPWFGPKRFGVGLSPRSWQGYVVSAALVVVVVVIVTATGGHSPTLDVIAIAIVPVVAIIRMIAWSQRR